MCVSVCASELKRIRDRKFRALDISFRNYFRKNLNMCPKAKNTLPLQYFSLTVSRSLSLFLCSSFSFQSHSSTIAYSLLVMSTWGSFIDAFFYQLALSFKLIIKQHPNIKINTIFKKFIRIRLCYIFLPSNRFYPSFFRSRNGWGYFFPLSIVRFSLVQQSCCQRIPIQIVLSWCVGWRCVEYVNTKIWWLQLLRSMHLMSFSTTFAWAEKKFFAS